MVGKCDFCYVVAEIVEDTPYQYCAYCAAVAPHINKMDMGIGISFEAMQNLRALCAIANVFEKRMNKNKEQVVCSPGESWLDNAAVGYIPGTVTAGEAIEKLKKRGRPRRTK